MTQQPIILDFTHGVVIRPGDVGYAQRLTEIHERIRRQRTTAKGYQPPKEKP